MTRYPAALLLALPLVLSPAAALAGAVSLYLDGAVVERDEKAAKGYLEFILPGAAVRNSLRIRPAAGCEIVRVATAPPKAAKSVEKELAAITAREEQLADRLKALTVREEIFKSAAKSQSAKAPRRTKTNPEPLSTIRQGTDYAIAQLEAVYQARRKAEKELAQLAERRTSLQGNAAGGGSLVRVWVKPANGSVAVSWGSTGRNWSPVYELRAGDDSATIAMLPGGVKPAPNETITLYPASIQSEASAAPVPFLEEGRPLSTVSHRILATRGGSRLQPLSLSLANDSAAVLPPGEVSCYRNGVYLGAGKLATAESGKKIEITCSGN